MATMITQSDNQAYPRFGGLYWAESRKVWVQAAYATDYFSESAALAAIDSGRAPSEGVRIVNYPQISLPPVKKTPT